MEITNSYIKENENRFLEELFGLIRIPSISSQTEHKGDMIKCAEYWRDSILAAGADRLKSCQQKVTLLFTAKKSSTQNFLQF